jgi:hypothetical protein
MKPAEPEPAAAPPENTGGPSSEGGVFSENVLRAGAVFIAAFGVYLATALMVGRHVPPHSVYYDELAEAFARGRLHLENPSGVYDLTPHEGRWYVPFLPLPALSMLPWVAVFGLANTNAVWFSIFFGAATIAFASLLLDAMAARGLIGLGPNDRLRLCLLLGLGTAYWYATVESSVWYLAQTYTVTFVAMAAWLSTAYRSPWPASTALAIALWARPNVIFTWPLLAALATERAQAGAGLQRSGIVRWSAHSVIPLAISIAGLLGYNAARFGDPLDFGYKRQNVSGALIYDLLQYGQFSYHYITRNVYHMLLAPPAWPADGAWPEPDAHGMSILLTTPALFWLAWARGPRPLVKGAWISIALLLAPLVTYYNTGWRQFGYRFSLDFIIPALVLIAIAAGPRMSPLLRAAILAGVAVNAYGVWWWFEGASWLS